VGETASPPPQSSPLKGEEIRKELIRASRGRR